MNNFVRFPFLLLISWPVNLWIGNCDQIHSQVVSSKRHMGKLAIMAHKSRWIFTRSLAGGLSSLLRGPTGRNKNGPA